MEQNRKKPKKNYSQANEQKDSNGNGKKTKMTTNKKIQRQQQYFRAIYKCFFSCSQYDDMDKERKDAADILWSKNEFTAWNVCLHQFEEVS